MADYRDTVSTVIYKVNDKNYLSSKKKLKNVIVQNGHGAHTFVIRGLFLKVRQLWAVNKLPDRSDSVVSLLTSFFTSAFESPTGEQTICDLFDKPHHRLAEIIKPTNNFYHQIERNFQLTPSHQITLAQFMSKCKTPSFQSLGYYQLKMKSENFMTIFIETDRPQDIHEKFADRDLNYIGTVLRIAQEPRSNISPTLKEKFLEKLRNGSPVPNAPKSVMPPALATCPDVPLQVRPQVVGSAKKDFNHIGSVTCIGQKPRTTVSATNNFFTNASKSLAPAEMPCSSSDKSFRERTQDEEFTKKDYNHIGSVMRVVQEPRSNVSVTETFLKNLRKENSSQNASRSMTYAVASTSSMSSFPLQEYPQENRFAEKHFKHIESVQDIAQQPRSGFSVTEKFLKNIRKESMVQRGTKSVAPAAFASCFSLDVPLQGENPEIKDHPSAADGYNILPLTAYYTVATVAGNILIASNITLMQKHPELIQFIKPTVEKAILDCEEIVIGRSMEFIVTSYHKIEINQFDLQHDENVRISTHRMVCNLATSVAVSEYEDCLRDLIVADLIAIFSAELALDDIRQEILVAVTTLAKDNIKLASTLMKNSVINALPDWNQPLPSIMQIKTNISKKFIHHYGTYSHLRNMQLTDNQQNFNTRFTRPDFEDINLPSTSHNAEPIQRNGTVFFSQRTEMGFTPKENAFKPIHSDGTNFFSLNAPMSNPLTPIQGLETLDFLNINSERDYLLEPVNTDEADFESINAEIGLTLTDNPFESLYRDETDFYRFNTESISVPKDDLVTPISIDGTDFTGSNTEEIDLPNDNLLTPISTRGTDYSGLNTEEMELPNNYTLPATSMDGTDYSRFDTEEMELSRNNFFEAMPVVPNSHQDLAVEIRDLMKYLDTSVKRRDSTSLTLLLQRLVEGVFKIRGNNIETSGLKMDSCAIYKYIHLQTLYNLGEAHSFGRAGVIKATTTFLTEIPECWRYNISAFHSLLKYGLVDKQLYDINLSIQINCGDINAQDYAIKLVEYFLYDYTTCYIAFEDFFHTLNALMKISKQQRPKKTSNKLEHVFEMFCMGHNTYMYN